MSTAKHRSTLFSPWGWQGSFWQSSSLGFLYMEAHPSLGKSHDIFFPSGGSHPTGMPAIRNTWKAPVLEADKVGNIQGWWVIPKNHPEPPLSWPHSKARAQNLSAPAWRSDCVPAGFGLEAGNQAEFPGPWLSGMEIKMPQQVKNWLFHLKDGKKGEKMERRGRKSKREKELLPLNNWWVSDQSMRQQSRAN